MPIPAEMLETAREAIQKMRIIAAVTRECEASAENALVIDKCNDACIAIQSAIKAIKEAVGE